MTIEKYGEEKKSLIVEIQSLSKNGLIKEAEIVNIDEMSIEELRDYKKKLWDLKTQE